MDSPDALTDRCQKPLEHPFWHLTTLGFSRNTRAHTQLLGFRILLAADASKEVEFGM